MDNFCSNEACTSPWFMFIFIGSLSFNITSKLLLPLSFTMDKFGRVSLKISNTGFWSCSSLKHERSNRKSVTKWSIFTSWTALIAPICRSNAAQIVQIQFTLSHILWYVGLCEKEFNKNLKRCNTFDFKVHKVRFLRLNLRLLGFRHRFGCFNSFFGSTPCHFGLERANSTNDGGKLTNYPVPISTESTSLLTQQPLNTDHY